MTDAQLEAKLREHAAITAPAAAVDRLIGAVWTLDRADDAGVVARLSAAS
jgi:hypothetical protein